ncbi:MAG TPA: hypothetical protein PLV96_00465 [Methanoregulaceae archaeon]|jgi:hypothetical protein|nr:hypothetical protein [Methanoregulaceae archaeon]HQN17558.1 hypothetical protein [Syntrophobacteraceae bacterium]
MDMIVSIDQQKWAKANNAALEKTEGNVDIIDQVKWTLERIFGEGAVSILPIDSRKS